MKNFCFIENLPRKEYQKPEMEFFDVHLNESFADFSRIDPERVGTDDEEVDAEDALGKERGAWSELWK